MALHLTFLVCQKQKQMQRTRISFLLVLGLLVGVLNSINAQKFEGIAHYKSSMSMSAANVTGNDMDPGMQESLRKQIAQQMQRDFTLKFNLQEAIWREKEELDPVTNTASSGGVQIRLSTGNSKSYINPSQNLFLEETEIFGKKFLIQDELPPYRWKITGEQKKIGEYTVIKATYMDIQEQMTLSMDDSETTTKTIQDTTFVTAWYTPEIPVSQGPNNTFGLPGLILELKQDQFSYLCTKIELNPAEPVTIEKPSKGQKVTQAEADRIRDEKLQEMMKKYDTGDGGTTRVIRIGG